MQGQAAPDGWMDGWMDGWIVEIHVPFLPQTLDIATHVAQDYFALRAERRLGTSGLTLLCS